MLARVYADSISRLAIDAAKHNTSDTINIDMNVFNRRFWMLVLMMLSPSANVFVKCLCPDMS